MLQAMSARGEFGDDYQVYLRVLYEAYAAQFRTVEEVWAHDLRYAVLGAAGVDVPVPQLPPGACVADAKTLIRAYNQDVQDAKNASRRPVPADPAGVVAFTTPARRHCRRFLEPLELKRSQAGPPVRCLLMLEMTAREAHVCFVWQRDGGSVCNEIERLATHVYWDRFAASFAQRMLRPWLQRHLYQPDRIFFYEYDPWQEKTGALPAYDKFSSVQLAWVDGKGFGDPSWTHHKSVPPYIVSLCARQPK